MKKGLLSIINTAHTKIVKVVEAIDEDKLVKVAERLETSVEEAKDAIEKAIDKVERTLNEK